MFDIGFWELLIIAVVLLLVMGPERLPEVAKQAAFLVRKARQGMYRLRSEMQGELDGTPFSDIEKAKQELRDLKNDLRQFGRELADSAEQDVLRKEQQAEDAGPGATPTPTPTPKTESNVAETPAGENATVEPAEADQPGEKK